MLQDGRIHCASHSFNYRLHCKWTVYYSDSIAAGLQSGGHRGGLWEDGSDGAVKEKGWGLFVTEEAEWGSCTIDLQLRGPSNRFSSEPRVHNVRDEWLRRHNKKKNNN